VTTFGGVAFLSGLVADSAVLANVAGLEAGCLVLDFLIVPLDVKVCRLATQPFSGFLEEERKTLEEDRSDGAMVKMSRKATFAMCVYIYIL
jgi:hypothetical protein